MSEINPSDLKVVDLRSELSIRNLPTKGKKDELIARLTEALELEKKNETEKEEKVVETKQDQTEKEDQKPEGKIIEKPAEEIKENKSDDQTFADNVEKQTPAESINEEVAEEKAVENPVQEVAEVTEESVVPLNKEAVDEKPIEEKITTQSKEQAVKKPSHQEAVKEDMDTDVEAGVKRKRALDTVDNEEEKRVKIDTKNTNNEANSSAIYVKGFVRPLIIRHVQDLFSKYGKVQRFWMDSIKTHCYVIYENDIEAKEAFKNVNGIKFPEDTGKLLTVESLTEVQVESLIEYEQSAADRRLKVDWEASIERVKSGLSLPSSPATDGARKIRSIGIGQVARQLAQAIEPTNASLSREVRIERPQKPKDFSLDELFRKTTTLPHLYYLPNTDEEAKIKLEKLQNV